MKIFVDFDDVLFNTRDFAAALIALFEEHGVSKKQFEESYHAFPHRDPVKQFGYIEENFSIDTKKLRTAFDAFIQEDIEKYLFDDVHDFLSHLPRDDLYLLTFGAKVFQQLKIDGAGMEQYFHKMIVTRTKKIEKITQIADAEGFPGNEKIILIDDHPQQLENKHRGEHGVMCIHMRRDEGRYSRYACMGCDGEVTDLAQARELIDQIAS